MWGNVVDVQVQIQPFFFFPWGDLLDELKLIPIEIPDPIGPIVEQFDPSIPLKLVEAQPLSVVEKQALYKGQDVPVHRFAFQEAQKLLALPDPGSLVLAGQSPFLELGLQQVELEDLLGKLLPTDGNTSFEELRCVGLYPEATS